MELSQDIGMIRRALMHKALSEPEGQPILLATEGADPQVLRELLDEAHARIRALEKAIARLTAAL